MAGQGNNRLIGWSSHSHRALLRSDSILLPWCQSLDPSIGYKK